MTSEGCLDECSRLAHVLNSPPISPPSEGSLECDACPLLLKELTLDGLTQTVSPVACLNHSTSLVESLISSSLTQTTVVSLKHCGSTDSPTIEDPQPYCILDYYSSLFL